MIALRLALINIKRVLRSKSVRLVLLALPLLVALLRVIFPGVKLFLRATELCPIVCALILGVLLFSQWAMDRERGLIAGFHASPVSSQGLVLSRALSGVMILLAQMVLFVGILAIRF